MTKYIPILVFFISCTSNKPILEYLKQDINKNPDYEKILVKEIDNFSILNGNYLMFHKNKENKTIGKSKYIDSLQYQKIKSYIESDFKKKEWKESDFQNIGLKLLNKKSVFDINDNLLNDMNNNIVYFISKPIFYKTNFVIFDIQAIKEKRVYLNKAVIMQKRNGNWTIVEELNSTDL